MYGVDYVVFEDLTKIKKKKRKVINNPNVNRKITKFSKKQVIIYGTIKALKLGFKVVFVNPEGTLNSNLHKKIMKKFGLDKHMASAHIIALRGLKLLKKKGY